MRQVIDDRADFSALKVCPWILPRTASRLLVKRPA